MSETLQQGLSRLAPLPAPQLTRTYATETASCPGCGRRLTVLIRDQKRSVVPCDCGGREAPAPTAPAGTWEQLQALEANRFGHSAARLYPLVCAKPFERAFPLVRTRAGEAVLVRVLEDGKGEFLTVRDIDAYANRRADAADAKARDEIPTPRPLLYREDQVLPPLAPPDPEMVRAYTQAYGGIL